MTDLSSIKRRQILSGLMKLLGFIGLGFIAVPFFSSFSSKVIDAKPTSEPHWVISIPVASLQPGQIKQLSWSGGIAWVYRRSEQDIQSLMLVNTLLRDADSVESDQPERMKNNLRSARDDIFVFIPHESKRGCQVSLNEEKENALFTEPCFNAKFDAAGRILKNSGHRQQQNLAVPNHVIEKGVLKIGIWSPKISKH